MVQPVILDLSIRKAIFILFLLLLLLTKKIIFVNNWNLFWERPRLFCADGLHPSRVGAELLSDNFSRMLRSI